jgi:Flp pilus assembly protein TadB
VTAGAAVSILISVAAVAVSVACVYWCNRLRKATKADRAADEQLRLSSERLLKRSRVRLADLRADAQSDADSWKGANN